MPRSLKISFANLTCRFGDRHVLLDLAKEVLLPAVFNHHIRNYGKTSFFFMDVGWQLVDAKGLPGQQLILFGRIVRDGIITRNQIYDPSQGLVADDRSMQSSPSSIWALDLNNHKLIFSPEFPYAPTLDNFTTTLQRFINIERETYVRSLYQRSKLTAEPKTLSYFYEEIPRAEVLTTPLATGDGVTEFVQRFAKVTSVSIKLLDTNAEFPRGNLFKQLREAKDETHARTTSLIHQNSAGLDKEAVASEVGAAAAGGNQQFTIRGVDEDGIRLTGDNERVKFQLQVHDLPDTVPQAAEQMVRVFAEQVDKGRLVLDDSQANSEKIRAIVEALPK